MATIQSRAEETRGRILEAATDAFARYGYDGTGVAEICRRAGVTKGGFYHHFPSKQAVFLEMLDQWLEGIDAQLAAIHTGEVPVPDELLRMTGLVRGVFQDASGKLPIFLEYLTQSTHSSTVWQTTAAPLRKYQKYFAVMLAKGMEEGSLRRVDPDLAAHTLFSFALGLLVLGLLDPHSADWGQVAQGGMRLLLDGLAS
ncbi:MAG: TetR/AcrR family transcriptional regulator [Anaerolineae bacterium]|nr:TetR/AcrR family transcriptional regulator [Anaerolineae bacterium]